MTEATPPTTAAIMAAFRRDLMAEGFTADETAPLLALALKHELFNEGLMLSDV